MDLFGSMSDPKVSKSSKYIDSLMDPEVINLLYKKEELELKLMMLY